MTALQIKWAASHDWFLAQTRDGLGVVVIDRWVDRDSKSGEAVLTFYDFTALRDFAWY